MRIGIGRICFDLLSQPAHMDIHRAAVADEVPAPDAFKDEFARKHLAFVLGEEEQQFIFLGLERQRPAIQNHFAAGEIDDEIIEGQCFMWQDAESPFVFPISSRNIRVRRSWALTRASSSRMEKGLVR